MGLAPYNRLVAAPGVTRTKLEETLEDAFEIEVLGIEDPRAKELTFVGGNRDAGYLRSEVDAGRHDLAVTLAPVTIDQFIDVCRQNRMMPPKSTWFQPKIRSGLVMALLAVTGSAHTVVPPDCCFLPCRAPLLEVVGHSSN